MIKHYSKHFSLYNWVYILRPTKHLKSQTRWTDVTVDVHSTLLRETDRATGDHPEPGPLREPEVIRRWRTRPRPRPVLQVWTWRSLTVPNLDEGCRGVTGWVPRSRTSSYTSRSHFETFLGKCTRVRPKGGCTSLWPGTHPVGKWESRGFGSDVCHTGSLVDVVVVDPRTVSVLRGRRIVQGD